MTIEGAAVREHELTDVSRGVGGDVRDRLLAAFDRYIELGFEASLTGVQERDTPTYKLVLGFDGGEAFLLRKVQKVADEFELELFLERDDGLTLYVR